MVLCLSVFFINESVASGEFGGIGLQVVPVASGELVVLKVLPESPAGVAALKAGDFIVEVDGSVLAGSNFNNTVTEVLWGKPGTSVTLKYLRPGELGARILTLTRVPLNLTQETPPKVRMLVPEDSSAVEKKP